MPKDPDQYSFDANLDMIDWNICATSKAMKKSLRVFENAKFLSKSAQYVLFFGIFTVVEAQRQKLSEFEFA